MPQSRQGPRSDSPCIVRAREIIKAEASAIAAIELTSSFDAAIETMQACRGKIVTTGMGKAGLVARKFAATLCSTATPAVFLHPGESAHGDLGMIAPGDCLIEVRLGFR